MNRYIGVTSSAIDLKNVTVKIKDNVAEEVEIKFGEGNFSWTRANNWETQLDRGLIDTVVEGDQIPMEVSFSGVFDYLISDSGSITLTDALYGENGASAWVSTADGIVGQECAPYCTDIELTNTPNCTSGITNPIEEMIFPQFRADSIAYDVQAGTVTISGKSNAVKPTSVRSA